MAIISRQTGLLSAENWKKVYQTFREADFTAYDFETLRKSMIDYIKLNYAEDYNDFTESSEFIALIDLVAFLGQSLAFRTDLNARENFMDTAERRDSVLKLARMISYNPKRSISGSGLLKIDSVSTTETVYDSDGFDLSNTQILWDDTSNENWLEQFSAVMNACFVSGQIFGKPGASKTVGGVRNDEYSINVTTDIVPVYRFTAAIEGQDMNFEVVSATSYNQSYIYEASPDINKSFNILYRNDSGGNSSNNTGFFFYFKQGEMNKLDFVINEMLPNKVVNIDVNNINNSDVWLYSLDADGRTNEEWKKVPATSGINVIYNTQQQRNLFQVNSRLNDQISFVFGDGSFANIPQGNFRAYFRTNNGLNYKITPDEMRGIAISFDYISRYNRVETITFRASLRYTVANAQSRESIEDIKQKAPQQYYTQNRMITGEDYNILPYTNYSDITKVKAINRTSSGLSRYLDVLDTTGKYSSTNIFGEDGVLYAERAINQFSFSFNTAVDIRRVLRNNIIPNIVASKEMMHYFYATTLEQPPIDTELSPSAMKDGEIYTILDLGTTDFTKYGAEYGRVGETFIAKDSGIKTRNYSVNGGPCYDMAAFVAQYRGSYSAVEYQTMAEKIMPLYRSNNQYTLLSGEIRYGLYRNPDHAGLSYWTDQCLSTGTNPETGAFYTTFFTSVDAVTGYTRHLTSLKTFDPGTGVCGFYDEPAGYTTRSYVFSGDSTAVNPTLTVKAGDVLVFDVNAVGHPFWIKTVAVTGTNGLVTTGVITGNGASDGTITWDTEGVAPGTYFYICQNHSDMSGLIIVEGFGTGRLKTGLKWNLSTIGDNTVTGYFSYNTKPAAIVTTAGNRSRFMRPGALLRCVAPLGYYFNSNANLVRGQPNKDTETRVLYTAITQVVGDGTNSGQGNFTNGIGPVTLNLKIPTGAIVESVIPVFHNSLSDSVVNQAIVYIESFTNFGLFYNTTTQAWEIISPADIVTSTSWWIKFEYSLVSNVFNVYHRGINYVLHSPKDTNFFYDESLQFYDIENNKVIRDSIKILKVNRDPRFNQGLSQDYSWYVHKPITRTDGYVENKSIYLTYADTNDDSVPDFPDLFDRVVLGTPLNTTIEGINSDYYSQEINRYFRVYLGRYPNQNEVDYWFNQTLTGMSIDDVRLAILNSLEAESYRAGVSVNDNMVFFELTSGYDQYGVWKLIDNSLVISNHLTISELTAEVIRNYYTGQLIYVQNNGTFYQVLETNGVKTLSQELNSITPNIPRYKAYVGRQNLYFQYRHNSPNTHRIDPSISNIIDVYMLTNEYDSSYRLWVQDSSNKVIEPTAPTNTELQISYSELENFKSISDTMVFHSAVFKPLFGSKADNVLQATFKVVKNASLNLSDADIKTSVIRTINEYFASENWDFGETFYFSELSAYLHKELSPDIASIIIVPKDNKISFGSFYQINAEPYEILISAATVDDVEIISAITAAQLNQNLSISNQTISL